MALSKPKISLEKVLIAFARAHEFEQNDAGLYFPLADEFYFLPRHSMGCDARFPSLAIARYARKNYGIVVGREEDYMEAPPAMLSEDEDQDEVFERVAVNLVDERSVLENLMSLEARMVAMLEAQEKFVKELVAKAEKRTALRISNARSAASEAVEEMEGHVLQEIRQGRGVEVFEVKSTLDSASPLSVVGSATLRREVARTSEYGSCSSDVTADSNNNGSSNNDSSHNNASGGKDAEDDVLQSYREATKEVRRLEEDVKSQLMVMSSRARLAEDKNENNYNDDEVEQGIDFKQKNLTFKYLKSSIQTKV